MITTKGKCIFYYAIAVLLALVNYFLIYPGLYNNDSLSQINQAILNSYGDWHPPLMAILMHCLYPVFKEGGSLFIQQVFYWTGLAFLLSNIYKNYKLWYLLLGFLPLTLLQSFVVWKDAYSLNCIVWFVGISLSLRDRKSYFKWLAWSFVLICGYLIRLNSFIYLFPLSFFCLLYISKEKNVISIFKLLLISIILIGLSFSINNCLYKIFKIQKEYPQPTLMLWDIAGIDTFSKKDTSLPEYIKKEALNDAKNWEKYYDSSTCISICWSKAGINCGLSSQKEVKQLSSLWLKKIKENPRGYFEHRFAVSSLLLGLQGKKVHYPYHHIQWQPREDQYDISSVGRDYLNFYYSLADKMIAYHLYQYPIYFILSLVLLSIIFFRFNFNKFNSIDLFSIGLMVSSFFNTVSLLFIAVAADYRYNFVSILFILIACLLCLKNWGQNKKCRVN